MRERIQFDLNGRTLEAGGADAFLSLSDFLRERRRLTGTKVVCAEGDCGACTVLAAPARGPQAGEFKSINSCIAFVFQMDGHQLVTVEGLADGADLHPVQQSMVDHFGAQCGFCTPGFVGSLAYLNERARTENFPLTEKKCRNFLTGNLCRCTGYRPILTAALNMKPAPLLSERYDSRARAAALARATAASAKIAHGSVELFLPSTMDEALDYRARHPDARVVAGATDLGVLINKNRLDWTRVIGLGNIAELYEIRDDGTALGFGARVTLDRAEAALDQAFPESGRLLHVFASPQIKNAATLAGNVINASPIGDMPPFLMVAGARVVARGPRGSRKIPLTELYVGYKKLSLAADEIVTAIEIPKSRDRFCLFKASVRKDLDISAVTFAAAYRLENGVIADPRIAVGGVAATVIRVPALENHLRGRPWSKDVFEKAAALLRAEIRPLSDVRGGREYRLQVAGNFLLKMHHEARP